jgi:4-amino-4-deoxy-L-arabinose transferase-like glycosyltransferase
VDAGARHAGPGEANVSSDVEGSIVTNSVVTPRAAGAILALILAGSFALKLRHLDHAAVKPLDEVFHAIVARNFLKHPLTPTLVDRPFLPYDPNNWLGNHIWLHKPPMALWQIALSYALLGVNTLALRLPSAIFSTLAVWLTYLIGVRLLDRVAALTAAALQAFNPVTFMLIHGYVFSDHVDIVLLFWTELSIYFLIRSIPLFNSSAQQRALFLVLCGISQGLAFLTKSYPALIVTVLALVAINSVKPRRLLALLLATLLAIAPWTLWTAIRFPHEFAYANLQILHHLNENVEDWAAPWDQLVFYYWISIFHVFYPAIIAASAVFLLRAFQEKRLALWLIAAWAAGVMIPHLLATSKPMCATLIGWPAAWLIFGDLVSRAFRGDRVALGTWLVSMLLAVILLQNELTFVPQWDSLIPKGGGNWNQTNLPFATIARQHIWVLWYTTITLVAGIAIGALRFSSKAHGAAVGFSLLASVVLFTARYLRVAFAVTSINANVPDFAKLAEFAARLPSNAAFLVDEHIRFENKLVEFATDRTCYSATEEDWSKEAHELAQAGALPYLFTPVHLPLPVAFVDIENQRTVYACSAAAESAAKK